MLNHPPGTEVTFTWYGRHNLVGGGHRGTYLTKEQFDDCSGPVLTNKEYEPLRPKVTLSERKMHYFACGVEDHCKKGMKVAIRVR